MVLRAQWPLGTIAQFFHFVAEEKKDKKTKAFYDWATTGIPVKRHFSDLKGMQYQSVILEKNIFPLCKTEIF